MFMNGFAVYVFLSCLDALNSLCFRGCISEVVNAFD